MSVVYVPVCRQQACLEFFIELLFAASLKLPTDDLIVLRRLKYNTFVKTSEGGIRYLFTNKNIVRGVLQHFFLSSSSVSLLSNLNKIGGPDLTVEIDKSLFIGRKYQARRVVPQ